MTEGRFLRGCESLSVRLRALEITKGFRMLGQIALVSLRILLFGYLLAALLRLFLLLLRRLKPVSHPGLR